MKFEESMSSKALKTDANSSTLIGQFGNQIYLLDMFPKISIRRLLTPFQTLLNVHVWMRVRGQDITRGRNPENVTSG